MCVCGPAYRREDQFLCVSVYIEFHSRAVDMGESARQRFRLVADPSIGVSDLEAAIKKFLDKAQEQKPLNLYDFLAPPPSVTWKSAVHVPYLCRISPLLLEYIQVASNAVLPGKRHKQALCKLDERLSLNNHRTRSREDWADFIDDRARMALAHLRSLKQEVPRQRAFRKADQSQVATLDDLLSRIVLPMGAEDAEAEPVVAPAAEGVMVPLADDPTREPPAEQPATREPAALQSERPQSSLSLESNSSDDPLDIFKNVLAKKSEEDETTATTAFSPQKKRMTAPSASSSSSPPKSFLGGLMRTGALNALNLSKEDEALLLQAQAEMVDTQKPKPKGKAKCKAMAKAGSFFAGALRGLRKFFLDVYIQGLCVCVGLGLIDG